MRGLRRNKRPVYYAMYEGVEEMMRDGYYTGGREKFYAPVQKVLMDVGASRTAYGFVSSVVQMELQGLDKPYSKVAMVDDINCPITEETIIWLDMGNLEEFSEEGEYSSGDMVIYDGKIWKCNQAVTPSEFDPAAWDQVPHNYIVTGIARSLNFIAYMLKEVDLR